MIFDDLADDQHAAVLLEAWQAARSIGDPALRAAALSGLLPAVAGDAQSELLRETLAVVQQIENVDSRAEALSQLIAYRPAEERPTAARAVLDLWQ